MTKETTLLLNITLALVLIGALMAYSTPFFPRSEDGAVLPPVFAFPWWHVAYVMLGLACMAVAALFNYQNLCKRPVLYSIVGVTLAMLIVVLIQGSSIRGGTRWISVGGVSFQPSELAKFTLVLFLAVKLSENQKLIQNFWSGFAPPYLIMGAFALLVLAQRDLGAPIVMGVTTMVMILVAGARWRHWLLGILPALSVVAMLILATPYRLNRVKIFRDPWSDSANDGYQLTQSLAAFARGGLWGQGLGAGEQKLNYLPDAHSDFVFAIWAEEMGLAGTIALIVLFALLLIVAMRIALCAKDTFGSFLAMGIVTLITLQTILNIGVTTSLLPTKGLPLPFISEGGSALLVNMMMVGILISIGMQSADEPARNARSRRTAGRAPARSRSR